MLVVSHVLYEEVVKVAWDVATDRADDIDEEVFPNAKSEGYRERWQDPSQDHDEEVKAMVSLWFAIGVGEGERISATLDTALAEHLLGFTHKSIFPSALLGTLRLMNSEAIAENCQGALHCGWDGEAASCAVPRLID